MSDFNIQQVKAKLAKDLKENTHIGKVFEKDLESLEKRIEKLSSDSTNNDSASDTESKEHKILEKMQAEFDESLNKAVLEFTGKDIE